MDLAHAIYSYCGRLFALILIVLFIGMASSDGFTKQAMAQDEQAEELRELRRQIEEGRARKARAEQAAKDADTEVERNRQQVIAVTADLQSREARAGELEESIHGLEIQAVEQRRVLEERREEVAGLLGALERLASRPKALALLQPNEAITTARSTSLLATLIPEVEKKVGQIREDLQLLATTENALRSERSLLSEELIQLTASQDWLNDLIADRRAAARQARGDAAEEARRINRLVREAKSLEDLVDKLADEQKRTAAAAAANPKTTTAKTGGNSVGPLKLAGRFSKAKGQLPFPVSGRVSKYYGSAQPAGKLRGIRIRSRAKAQVISPFDGQVVFAGRFRTYGELVIINHGDNYHSVMAGLRGSYVIANQWVMGGDPIGNMRDRSAPAPELYLELRRQGTPFNPIRWLKVK